MSSTREERDEERTSKAVDEGGNGDHGAGRLRRLGAGTCQNPSLATITVNTWDELKDCVACANTNANPFRTYLCNVNADLTGTGTWNSGNGIVITGSNAKVKIKGTKAGGGVAKIKGQGQSGGYRVFHISGGAQVEMEKLDIRDGHLSQIYPNNVSCCDDNVLRSVERGFLVVVSSSSSKSSQPTRAPN